ncbi:MAG: sigma-70 family RNA polymerase sigma factor [Planctomycetes bacterium]|nr:sigma-70 family RNA polymerase sigma factor [Planctomycetota bacterium]
MTFASSDSTPSFSAPDASFVRFLDSGDPDAFTEFYRSATPVLLRHANKQIRDARSAAEIVQDCFAIAIEQRQRFDRTQPVLPWMIGILKNRVRVHWRDERRRHEPLDAPSVASDQSGVEESHAERRELVDVARRAIAGLPESYRVPVALRFLEGRSIEEIARELEANTSTVRTGLSRGVALLRDAMPADLIGAALALALVLSTGRAAPLPPSSTGGLAKALPGRLRLFTLGLFVVAAIGIGWGASQLVDAPGTSSAIPDVASPELAQVPPPETGLQRQRADLPTRERPTTTVRLDLVWPDEIPLEARAHPPVRIELPGGGAREDVRSTLWWQHDGVREEGTEHTLRFDLDRAGEFSIVMVPAQRVLTRASIGAGEERRARLAIPKPLHIVRGVVRDHAGPLAGAVVRAGMVDRLGDEQSFVPGVLAATTNAKGEFAVAVFRIGTVLWAEADGHAASPMVDVFSETGAVRMRDFVLASESASLDVDLAVPQSLDPSEQLCVAVCPRRASGFDAAARFARYEGKPLHFSGLAPGAYVVAVRGRTRGLSLRSLDTLSGSASVTLRVGDARIQRGTIAGYRGANADGALVAIPVGLPACVGLGSFATSHGQVSEEGDWALEGVGTERVRICFGRSHAEPGFVVRASELDGMKLEDARKVYDFEFQVDGDGALHADQPVLFFVPGFARHPRDAVAHATSMEGGKVRASLPPGDSFEVQVFQRVPDDEFPIFVYRDLRVEPGEVVRASAPFVAAHLAYQRPKGLKLRRLALWSVEYQRALSILDPGAQKSKPRGMCPEGRYAVFERSDGHDGQAGFVLERAIIGPGGARRAVAPLPESPVPVTVEGLDLGSGPLEASIQSPSGIPIASLDIARLAGLVPARYRLWLPDVVGLPEQRFEVTSPGPCLVQAELPTGLGRVRFRLRPRVPGVRGRSFYAEFEDAEGRVYRVDPIRKLANSGEFVLHVPPGSWQVRVRSSWRESGLARFELLPGERQVVDIPLAPRSTRAR